MGYFPGYDMEPCSQCGKTECTGNCRSHPAIEIKHFDRSGNFKKESDCQCYVCQNMRERQANRNTK